MLPDRLLQKLREAKEFSSKKADKAKPDMAKKEDDKPEQDKNKTSDNSFAKTDNGDNEPFEPQKKTLNGEKPEKIVTEMKTFREFVAENSAVGKTIIDQIKAQDRHAMMAWGAKNIVYGRMDVQFDIKTPKYSRGHRLVITLNSGDTYDITLIKITAPKLSMKTGEFTGGVTQVKRKTDIYAEKLVEVIDSMIENK